MTPVDLLPLSKNMSFCRTLNTHPDTRVETPFALLVPTPLFCAQVTDSQRLMGNVYVVL
ncbi:hypothetical protein KIPB_017022, partial [Kipferlia bialata]|eukprot:g17022.t1